MWQTKKFLLNKLSKKKDRHGSTERLAALVVLNLGFVIILGAE